MSPVSMRFTRESTANPAVPITNTISVLLPHWAGEIHAFCVKRITAIIPTLAGLKRCCPRIFKMNFCPMAIAAAKAYKSGSLLLNRSVNPNAVMSALLIECIGSFKK